MLYCTLLMLHGAGQGSLKCKTQPHVGTVVAYTLYNLPTHGTLVVGDGQSTWASTLAASRGEWALPPLSTHDVWAAYLSTAGEVLAVAAQDGVWREAHSAELYRYLEQQAADERAVATTAEQQEEAVPIPLESEPVDLADLGVSEIEGDAPYPDDVDGEETLDAVPAEAPLRPEELEDVLRLFEYYPPYAPLEALVSGSRWVRVGEEDAYLLGLLYDSTPALTHVCYGVEGTRDRPFSADAEWLAAEDGDKGYWIVYRQVE